MRVGELMRGGKVDVPLENLKPFEKGEERAKNLGYKGGLQSSQKKKLAARIRELRKRHPKATSKAIQDFVSLIAEPTEIWQWLALQIMELGILKDAALQNAAPNERYKLQKDYLRTSLEVLKIIYSDPPYFMPRPDQIPWHTKSEIKDLRGYLNMMDEYIKLRRREKTPTTPPSQ